MNKGVLLKYAEKVAGLIMIAMFFAAFYWSGDTYAYLDKNYWHLDSRESSFVDFYFFPLRWIAAFTLAFMPAVVALNVLAQIRYLSHIDEKAKKDALDEAKKASNLYIKTGDLQESKTAH